MKKISRKEIARDVIALGSPVFFLLVLARVALLSNFEYLSQFVIAGILFVVLFLFFVGNIHSGLGIIVLFFTTIYYSDLKFSIFAILLYFGLVASLLYLKKDKREIINGVIFGLISTGVSYILVKFIFRMI